MFAQDSDQRVSKVSGKIILTRQITENARIISQELIQQYALSSRRPGANEPAGGSELPHVVVYLSSTGGSVPTPEKKPPQYLIMDQKNERFIPHILPVYRGTEVRFLNSDSVFHNVFSLSPTKSFDLGRYPRGQYRAVTFDKPGVVNVYCDIHTHMSAYILVLDTPLFTVTDSTGTFMFENAPAGDYIVGVWYGRWGRKTQKLHLAPGMHHHLELTYP